MRWKRGFDLAVVAALLPFLLPIALLVAVAVSLESRGPVFFRQERVGQHFRPFFILKFRSMRPAAPGADVRLAAEEQHRVGRLGAWLRRSKLDELPQIVNVLRGEMSLVGPRPELARYVALYPDDFFRILRVPPGMTDPVSIEFVDEERILHASADPERDYVAAILPRKIQLARDYVDSWSPWQDVVVLARTARRLIAVRGRA